jgi:hypothetical protein
MTATPLDYANPRPFFTGVYRHHSRNGMWAIGAMLLFGFVFCSIPFAALTADTVPRIVFGSAGAASLLAGAYLAGCMILKKEDVVRITEDGIEYGRRRWHWQQISKVGGTGRTSITLGFTAGRGGIPFPRPLPTTPALTPEQYGPLMESLKTYLASMHPHVTVELEPRAE